MKAKYKNYKKYAGLNLCAIVHYKLYEFCQKNNYVMHKWVENLINKELDKIEQTDQVDKKDIPHITNQYQNQFLDV